MKPLIGLSPTPEVQEMDHGTFRLNTLAEYYSRSVEAAGGIPVILPSHLQDVEGIIDRLEGVIITGGGDIDPARFGQDAHETTAGIDTARDEFELALVKAALVREMPLLGICRGLQMLNVALGGTLYQDLDIMLVGATEHRQQKARVFHEETTQVVHLAPGDHPLRRVVDSNELPVNTFHHQGIDQLADGLQVMARSEDDLIEAVYKPDASFCMAVQWHPEMLAATIPEHAAVFRGLIEAAQTYATNKESEVYA